MRLSHVSALLVIGVALSAVPGVSVHRAGGRDGSPRVATRGGSYRFGVSQAVLHPDDGVASDVVLSGEAPPGGVKRQGGHPVPAVAPEAVAVQARLADSPGRALATAVPPRTERFLRPPGRAPPFS